MFDSLDVSWCRNLHPLIAIGKSAVKSPFVCSVIYGLEVRHKLWKKKWLKVEKVL